MKTHYLNLKIDYSQINFLNSIIEAYEGIAVVRTVDPNEGLVQLWVMPDFLAETRAVVSGISESIGLINLEWGDKMYAG